MGSVMELLQSGAKHRIEQGKIDGARIVQASHNEKEAATTALSRFSQSLANQRRMDAAGASYGADSQNIATQLDKATAGTFVQRIQASQELGAATVMAAAAGVGGGSVETFRRTLQLRQAVQEESQQRQVDANSINATRKQTSIIQEAVAGLGNDTFNPNFDNTVYLDHIKQENVLGAMILVGVASYFGGPQAGMATADALASGNRAANGDFNGSASLMGSAARNAAGAVDTYQKTNGDPWGLKMREGAVKADDVYSKSSSNAGGGFWGSGSSVGFKANGNSL